jgi:hypothetical protein
MTNLYCIGCKHYKEGPFCEAFDFPDMIPLAITMGKKLHDKPFPNQKNKIVYEPYEISDEEFARMVKNMKPTQ